MRFLRDEISTKNTGEDTLEFSEFMPDYTPRMYCGEWENTEY